MSAKSGMFSNPTERVFLIQHRVHITCCRSHMHMIFVTGRLTLIRQHHPIGAFLLLLNHLLFINHSKEVNEKERIQLHLVVLSLNSCYFV